MTAATATDPEAVDARRRHYATFYGLRDRDDDRALALVHGNCQAESLRLVLDGESLATIAMPPVHELTAEDLPHLHRWLARASVLVSQPVVSGYRGLPLGTGDLTAAAGAQLRLVIVPVVRFAGLYPEHAIIRPTGDPGAVPPLVAYHSLRVLAEAAGGRRARTTELKPGAVRAIAAASLAQLTARERRHGAVVISDVFAQPGFALMRTLNHPGNPVWLTLAARVLRALGATAAVRDPGRALLDAVHAPRAAAVIQTFGLPDEPTTEWLIDGAVVDAAELRDAHLAWYASHPGAVAAGLARHGPAMAALGLGPR